MSHLLIFNLATDADDPILGFTTDWINRLALRFDQVDVITMRAGRLTLAPNVHVWSVGKEKGFSEFRRTLNFYRVLILLLLTRRYAACFAHMMPLFAVMGAPLLSLFRVPITLWYTHRQAHRTLQWAERVARRVVTAAPDSFPLPTPKLRVIGHGIDTDFFSRDPEHFREKGQVIQVARLMPIKHQATLIRAVAALPDIHATFIGGVPPEQNADYQNELQALAADLGCTERITFAGDQPREAVRKAYRDAMAAVNLSPVGLFDKAALESMATGTLTIVANPAFDDLLGKKVPLLRIDSPDDVDGLAARLRGLQGVASERWKQIGETQRQRVVAAHGLDGLIRRLVDVLLTGEVKESA